MSQRTPSLPQGIRALLLGALWWATVVGFSSGDLFAQAGGSSIRGSVTDTSGAGIPGATIAVKLNW